MEYLSPGQILFIHSRLIDETGGGHGILDWGLLLLAIGRPQATFDEKDLYPDLHSKVAALFDSLIRNHPFVDGNKHTAITAAALFLSINGYRLVVDHAKMVRFTLDCAQSLQAIEEITEWFANNSSRYQK